MELERYSRRDRIAADGDRRGAACSCRARVRAFEEFIVLGPGSDREQAALRLAMEYRLRCDALERVPEVPPLVRGWVRVAMLAVPVGGALATGSWIAVGGMAVVWVAMIGIVRWVEARDPKGPLLACRCPDCDYDLRRCPPAIPAAQLDGLDAGPQRCPECRSPWPLVPACVPDTHAGTGGSR